MYYSMTFTNSSNVSKNTWDDWHLVPSSRPVIDPPAVKTNYIDIPGAHGSLDFTEALRGFPLYQNREGSIEFIVMHEYWDSWVETYQTILAFLHGQKLKLVLEEDPDYYYEGRFAVNNWKSDKDYSKITIDYSIDPYKTNTTTSAKVL